MKRERTGETGQPSTEENLRPRDSVLGDRTLCTNLIVPRLYDVLDVFNLSRTCRRLRFILSQNKHVIVAMAAYAEEGGHSSWMDMDIVPNMGLSRVVLAPPRMPAISLCAREGSLLAFRYFFQRRVWVYLEDSREGSIADAVAEPEVTLSFAMEEQHRNSAFRHFSEVVLFALTQAGREAAHNGHIDIVTEVAARCKQTPKSGVTSDALATHNFPVIAHATLRAAAAGGRLDICRKFIGGDVWGLPYKDDWTEAFGFLTVAEELLKHWTMKELGEWGVFALSPAKVRKLRFRSYAMSNSKDFAVFDWVHAAARAAGSKKTLSHCVGYVASRGNMALLKHVANRMLVEEVAHLKEAGPKQQWAEALRSVGKIEDLGGSKSPEKQERREQCVAWVYRQAGYDDGMRNGWIATMVNGALNYRDDAADAYDADDDVDGDVVGWEFRE